MNKGRIKEILDYIVALCTIISCMAAVYGVFQVVNFVIDVRPIVVPIAQEVKEGNLDMKTMLSGVSTRYDTILVTKRDTVYLSQDKIPQTKREDSVQWLKERRLTTKEKQQLDNSAGHISEEKKRDIDNQEDRFRQRMKDPIDKHRSTP